MTVEELAFRAADVLEKAGMASEPHPENDGRRFLESTIADALREALRLERAGRLERGQAMSERLTSDEVLAQLARVQSGEDVAHPVEWPQEHYCGDLEYRCESGWVLWVFNDCGDWDYLDHARSPDGREWEFDDDPNLGSGPETPRDAWLAWAFSRFKRHVCESGWGPTRATPVPLEPIEPPSGEVKP